MSPNIFNVPTGHVLPDYSTPVSPSSVELHTVCSLEQGKNTVLLSITLITGFQYMLRREDCRFSTA
jgi:hypothetical protein